MFDNGRVIGKSVRAAPSPRRPLAAGVASRLGRVVRWPLDDRMTTAAEGRITGDPPGRLRGGDAFRLHLTLTLGLALCVSAFIFEVMRALGGNSLSWAYVFEWPIFAVFAIYMWWNLLHGNDGLAASASGVGAPPPGGGPGETGPKGDQDLCSPGRPICAPWRPTRPITTGRGAPGPTWPAMEAERGIRDSPTVPAGPADRNRHGRQTRPSACSNEADTPPSTPKTR